MRLKSRQITSLLDSKLTFSHLSFGIHLSHSHIEESLTVHFVVYSITTLVMLDTFFVSLSLFHTPSSISLTFIIIVCIFLPYILFRFGNENGAQVRFVLKLSLIRLSCCVVAIAVDVCCLSLSRCKEKVFDDKVKIFVGVKTAYACWEYIEKDKTPTIKMCTKQ